MTTQAFAAVAALPQGAACAEVGTEAFYPTGPPDSIHANAAKAVCAQCPILDECRDHALRWEAFGIWGGMTQTERTRRRVELGIPEPSDSLEDNPWGLP